MSIDWGGLLGPAVPLLLLIAFMALVYFGPETRAAIRKTAARVSASGWWTGLPAPRSQPARPVRRRATVVLKARSIQFQTVRQRNRIKLMETSPRAEQGFEQPRTLVSQPLTVSLETERARIAKQLYNERIGDRTLSETRIIEIVWRVKRGGGKSFVAAREAYMRAIDITEPPHTAEQPAIAKPPAA